MRLFLTRFSGVGFLFKMSFFLMRFGRPGFHMRLVLTRFFSTRATTIEVYLFFWLFCFLNMTGILNPKSSGKKK